MLLRGLPLEVHSNRIYYFLWSIEDLFINEKSIQQKVLKDINSGWGYSLPNTLYINDLIKTNMVDTPKVKKEDKQGDYYIYDYYFTKLSKDLRKESEE